MVNEMQLQGIRSILTFNTTDFRRYSGIDVIDPAEVKC